MPSFFRTLRFRLTLWFVGLLALMALAMSAVVYFGFQQALIHNADDQLGIAAERSVKGITAGGVSDDALQQLTLLGVAPARLVGLDGARIQTDALFPETIAPAPAALADAAAGKRRYETITTPAGTYRLFSAPVSVNDTRVAVVQVAQSLQNEINTLAELRQLLAIALPALLGLSGLGGAFLASRALAPMQRVQRDVEGIIQSGDLSRRVGKTLQPDEVGELARTFDRLLERVQQAVRRERQFIADASHELRSPLTVFRGELSVALSRPRTAQDYQETLAQLDESAGEMSALVEDLLLLARTDAPRAGESAPACDARALVTRVCERMGALADARAITLTLRDPQPSQPLMARGSEIKIQRIFVNLLDNAVRYTPDGGSITVELARAGNMARISIADTGIGIPAEHLPHIFERFYRVESSRSREAGGSGLGLAIARHIARSFEGDIYAQSQLGRGTTFTVELPLVAG